MIRSVRKILASLTTEKILNDENLLTLLAEVERILNFRLLTPVSSNPPDMNALTPNALIMGRLESFLPVDIFCGADGYKHSRRLINWLADQFWARWLKAYLPSLETRQRRTQLVRNLKVGDLVLVRDESLPRGVWPKARVIKIFPGKDGAVRSVLVKTSFATYSRDVRKLCLLEAVDSEQTSQATVVK